MIVLAFLLLYLSAIFVIHDNDRTVFVTPGSCFMHCTGNNGENCIVPPGASQLEIEGYDGQFNYYIARNPRHAAPCIDVPAYRYQRILLPILGYMLTGGSEKLISFAFVILNGCALIVSVRLLEDLLENAGQSRWFASGYGFFFGVVVAVRLSTAEPLAYGLAIAAIWVFQRNQNQRHRLTAFVLLALAGFAKETTGLFAFGFLLWFAHQKHWRDAFTLILITGVPFLVWQIYLYHWLGAFGIVSGGAKATGFEMIPFNGVLEIWRDAGFTEFLVRGLIFMMPVIILPTLYGLIVSWRDFAAQNSRRITLYTCLFFTQVIIMPFLPFSTYREYLGILRAAPGLVLMVILYSAERDIKRPLRYSLFYVTLLAFVLIG